MKISLVNQFDSSPVGQQFAVVSVDPDKAFSHTVVDLDPTRPEDELFVTFNLLADQRHPLRMRHGTRLVRRLLATP